MRLFIIILLFTEALYAQQTNEQKSNIYYQNNYILIANHLVKKGIVNKNYILVNENNGFIFDTLTNKDLSYNKYFSNYILKNINQKNLVVDSIVFFKNSCQFDNYFNKKVSVIYTPIILSKLLFFLIINYRKLDFYNIAQIFMITVEINNHKISIIAKSSLYE